MNWKPIEYAPKTGELILRNREEWDSPALLAWQTNPRTGRTYFGDPDELDTVQGAPTHFLRIPASPGVTQWEVFPYAEFVGPIGFMIAPGK